MYGDQGSKSGSKPPSPSLTTTNILLSVKYFIQEQNVLSCSGGGFATRYTWWAVVVVIEHMVQLLL